MMVYGLISNNSISGLGALNSSAGGKIALPVEPASLIYSHFKHVSGVPVPEGSHGLTISKLNILDVLIDQMNRIKKAPAISAARASEERMAARIEARIDMMKIQIQKAQEAHNKMPYIPAPNAETGSLFSLSL